MAQPNSTLQFNLILVDYNVIEIKSTNKWYDFVQPILFNFKTLLRDLKVSNIIFLV